MEQMKTLYISLVSLSAIFIFAFFYGGPAVQGLAVQGTTFNLELDIPSTYQNIESGSEIHFTTKILNLASENRIDISLRYEAVNEEGEVIASRTETVAIETQASFVGDLEIPAGAKEGNYNLIVTLIANDVEEASSEGSFQVSKQKNELLGSSAIVAAILITGVLIFFFILRSKTFLEKMKMKKKVHGIVSKRLNP